MIAFTDIRPSNQRSMICDKIDTTNLEFQGLVSPLVANPYNKFSTALIPDNPTLTIHGNRVDPTQYGAFHLEYSTI